MAGPAAVLETGLEVVGEADVSTAKGPMLGSVAAARAVCPGTAKLEGGEAASALTSGPPAATGVASTEGATRLVLDDAGPGLLTAGCTGTGSFLTGSGGCGGAWGGWAACCCTSSEAVGAETSLLPGFSGAADAVTSSVLFPEDMGREGADTELRRLPKDNVGNDAGGGVAVVVDGGAGDGTVLLLCWLPNEKLALLPLKVPPKLITPEGPALVSGRLPKMPVEELPVPVLAAAGGAAVVAAAEEGTGGSTGFTSTAGVVKLKPEDTLEVLAGWPLMRPVEEALLAGFVESSAWPTRSPEKLPRVSPAREFGNRSSPNLDGGVSSLLAAAEGGIPAGAAGLLPEGAESPEEAAAAPGVLGPGVTVEGGALSATVS